MAQAPPSVIGSIAEREVALRLCRAGWQVFVPLFAAHSRIDLVAARGDRVVRVQCKTSRLVKGAVCSATCSNTANSRRTYDGQVDAFGVFSPELDEVYLVPVDGVPSRLCSLRVDPTKNGQSSRVRHAATFRV